MLADAWESLTETNLKRAWRKLWPYNEGKDNNQEEDGDIDGAVNEITDICSKLPGFEECDKDDAMEWLAVDSNDPGYQILTDEEITDMLLNEGKLSFCLFLLLYVQYLMCKSNKREHLFFILI